MERLARFVVGYPWLVLLIWVLGIGMIVNLTPSDDAAKTPAPQPTAAQQGYALLYQYFPSSEVSGSHPPLNILLLNPDMPLPKADIAVLTSLSGFLRNWRQNGGNSMVDWPPVEKPSRDGHAFLISITLPWTDYCYDCQDQINARLATIRPRLHAGTTVELTGQGLIYQAQDKALAGLTQNGITPTLLACIVLLLVILGAVYRAPLAVLVPLASIGALVFTSLHLVKILVVHTTWVPYGDITDEFVSVVLFGAGSNYCIFLLSRYREGLRGGLARREALTLSLSRVGEAISSSAATVIAAMILMGFTLSPMFRAIGPSVAVSIALLLCAGLTLVPALVCLCGGALLWPTNPAKPRPSEDTTVWRQPLGGVGFSPSRRGFWNRVGALVANRPLPTMLVCLLLLGPLAAFAVTLSPSYDNLRTLPSSDPVVRASVEIQQRFGSSTEPAALVIASDQTDLSTSNGARAIGPLIGDLRRISGVLSVATPEIAPGGRVAVVSLSLGVETSSPAAHALVGRIQNTLAAAVKRLTAPGLTTFLTSDSAVTHDQSVQVDGDFRFIVLWVSIVVFVILALLVRSVSAPIYLLLSIGLSTGAAIGLTVLIFHQFLGQQIFYTTPVFAFVFLVALGEDFNILLMCRIREEVWRSGLRLGVARAVGSTGATLSNCGLIMAGTLGVLMSFNVTFLQQIGFSISAGILLDTFMVRPLLVPSVVCLLGRWNWVTFRGIARLPEP